MTVGSAVTPTVPLRYLATVNPRFKGRTEGTSTYLPMEAISEFGPVDCSIQRPTEELLGAYSVIADGDVAYAKVTPCFENGKGLIAEGLPDGHAFATTEISVFRPNTGLEGRYLAWVFQTADFRFAAEASMSGAGGLKRVSESFARSYPVPLPDLTQQEAIADYLDRETAQIDAFIAKNEELISLARERMQSLVDTTFHDKHSNKPWPLVMVRRLGVSANSGVSVNGSGVPAHYPAAGVLKTSSVSKATFLSDENKEIVPEDLGRARTPVRRGTLIVNRANTPALVGVAAVPVQSHDNLFLSDKLWQVQFKSADVDFVYWWTRTSNYREQLLALSVGSSSSMQNLSFQDFMGLQIPLPAVPVQKQVADQLCREHDRLKASESAAQRAIELAKERRAALISAAVTGKIDVRSAA